jgi:3-oxoacyl-(acyl-carrier-protein) synthase
LLQVFDAPTASAITSFIMAQMQPETAAAATSRALQHGSRAAAGAQRVLFIKGSSNPPRSLADYAAGGDGTSSVPFWRWDMDSLLLAASAAAEVQPRFGVFMSGVDKFDCAAFGISPLEATTMDPQQRLLLRAAAEALPPASSSRSCQLLTGVYVGIGSNDYEVLASHAGVSVSAFSFTAASAAVASGRLAYIFGLQGPSASVDTACSASLVALHMAASSLVDGTSDAALVAGVLLSLVPQSTLMVQRAGMLAADGRCKVLDADADGYVRGEACRAMWLEAASAAPAAEDGQVAGAAAPLAVILGTAVNSNGRASSLTAPHGPTQQALIAAALAAAGMAATEVSGLQVHANGTSLGDPIEVGAVVPAYQLAQGGAEGSSGSNSRPAFVFSTIKGYAGHSESAAGAVGVLEAVAVMLQKALAPALHVRHLNPYIAGPLHSRNAVINRSSGLAPVPLWQDRAVQGAGAAGAEVAMGVSSFGAQGTNAHAILGHSHSWALQRGTSGASGSSAQQQNVWQAQQFWVAPVCQRLISRALITRPERSNRAAGAGRKVAFEARLEAPGLAGLWSYLSTPAAPGQRAQPFLSNSLLLATAASAGSLLAGGSSAAIGQVLVLQDAVLAPPQQLPAYPGQPGVQMPVLLVACNVGTGSLAINVGGQRQLQCTMAVTAAAAESDAAKQPTVERSMTNRLQALLGMAFTAAAAAAAVSSAPGTLVGAQHCQQQMQAVSTLNQSNSDGFTLHPARLEGSLQSCMVTPGQATALWLSTVQAVAVPLASSRDFDAASSSQESWVAASFAHASNGNSCQVHSLTVSSGAGVTSISVTGAMLAADATTATEAAAATAEADAGVTSEAAAAAALSAVTAAANPLTQLDEAERALYLQAQIMSEVRIRGLQSGVSCAAPVPMSV